MAISNCRIWVPLFGAEEISDGKPFSEGLMSPDLRPRAQTEANSLNTEHFPFRVVFSGKVLHMIEESSF